MSEEREHSKKHHKKGGHGHHGGGGHEEGHEGAPEWLISFADNVVLIMGFFVILLAMNLKPTTGGAQGAGSGPERTEGQQSEEANAVFLDTAIAIREAFNNPVDLGSSDPKDIPLIERIRQRTGESEATMKGQKGHEHDVRSIRPGKYFSPGGSIRFDGESAELSAENKEVLIDLARKLEGLNLIIEIRGHVSAAEAFGESDRGMQLSHERAMTVAHLLAGNGLRWSQLRLVASADTDRLVSPAYDPESHGANQRVEVIVTDRVVQTDLREEDPGD